MPSNLYEFYRATDRWLCDHVIIQWLLLAFVPEMTYAGTKMAISDAGVHSALIFGTVFGVTFATITVMMQRWTNI
jgi:hypothetical protein